MHRAFVLIVAIALALIAAAPTARADLGPPPTCGPGEHDEYLRGHNCVVDGCHLEDGPNGVVSVKDDGSKASCPEAKGPPASPPPTKRGCGCVVAGGSGGVGGGIVAAVVLAASLLRRRRR